MLEIVRYRPGKCCPESGTPSTGNAVEDLQNPQMSTEVLQSASTVPPNDEKKDPNEPPPINFDVVPSLRGHSFLVRLAALLRFVGYDGLSARTKG